MPQHLGTRNILDHLSDLKGYPNETLSPYEEFCIGGETYYFTPGGSLYRKDTGTETSPAVIENDQEREGAEW